MGDSFRSQTDFFELIKSFDCLFKIWGLYKSWICVQKPVTVSHTTVSRTVSCTSVSRMTVSRTTISCTSVSCMTVSCTTLSYKTVSCCNKARNLGRNGVWTLLSVNCMNLDWNIYCIHNTSQNLPLG